MVFFVYWMILFISFGNTVTKDQHGTANSRENEIFSNTRKPISHLDLLIEDLTSQKWIAEEVVCQQKVLEILKNVKNSTLWAIWIWDSMQSPTGVFYGSRLQFGNYDQCMKAPWVKSHLEFRTQYCLADIQLYNKDPQDVVVQPYSSVDSYLNSISKHGVTFNTITWGVCVPVDCNSKAITKLVRSFFKHTHLGLTIPIADVRVDSCQIAGHSKEYSVGFYLVLFILAVAIITVIAGTIINDYYENNLHKDQEIHFKADKTGHKLIQALCMKNNLKSLNKEYKDDIPSMHGIRCLTAGIVVGLHVWFVNNFVGTINHLDVDKDTDRFNLTALAHAELVVDTYLMMSGLLLVKGMMSSSNQDFNPMLIILKRYLRLVLMLGLLLLLAMQVLVHSGDGPLWPRIAEKEANMCKKTWWLTLLMLGNYVDTANICYPILWTVPCDFHLSCIGVILIWLLKKNRRIVFATWILLVIAAIILPGVVTYQQKLPAVPSFNMRSIKDYRNTLFKNPTYLWSHLRAGPYLIGLAVGYVITIYKPEIYRRIIPKTYSVIGFFIALAIGLQIMVMGGTFQDLRRPYKVWEAVLFASLNRTIWAAAMACLIAFCEYGTVPVIGTFLKSRTFLPLSKLSYGTYLLHTVVFSRAIFSTRTPLNHDMFLMIFHTSGVLLICMISSMFLYIFFEAPLSKSISVMFNINIKKTGYKVKEHKHKNYKVHAEQKKTL